MCDFLCGWMKFCTAFQRMVPTGLAWLALAWLGLAFVSSLVVVAMCLPIIYLVPGTRYVDLPRLIISDFRSGFRLLPRFSFRILFRFSFRIFVANHVRNFVPDFARRIFVPIIFYDLCLSYLVPKVGKRCRDALFLPKA